MRACIHRGAAEVGGNCVELEADGRHLLIDVGRPLSDDLSEQPRPPAIRGFTASRDPELAAVVISHGHPDHYGLVFQRDSRIPVYMGKAASRILNEAAFFMGGTAWLEPDGFIEDRRPFELGPFTITPYLVDHSAFDSYALLVEAGGRRLLYSGDLRAHGRKPGTFQRLLNDPPADVGAMLMEGTRIGREADSGDPSSEEEVEREVQRLCEGTEGMVLAIYSPQNIDRYVSMLKAARRARRDLVVDLYAATVAAATDLEAIPQATWEGIRVFVPWTQRMAVKRNREFERVNRIGAERIFPEELAGMRDRVLMTFRASMLRDLVDAGCLKDAAAVWSMWRGYLTHTRNAELVASFEQRGIPLSVIHCSGHATPANLRRLAEAVAPERLVPIHTEAAESYFELFDHVETHADGQWWSV
jgi:ribonuclease J